MIINNELRGFLAPSLNTEKRWKILSEIASRVVYHSAEHNDDAKYNYRQQSPQN